MAGQQGPLPCSLKPHTAAELPAAAGWPASRRTQLVGLAAVLGVVALAGFSGGWPFTRHAGSSPTPALGLAQVIDGGGAARWRRRPGWKNLFVRVCHDEDCDRYDSLGLVHEFSMDLNTCARVTDNKGVITNAKYRVIGAASNTTLPDGVVLMVHRCSGEAGPAPVSRHPFQLIVGAFTDCCSFYLGGCGFKCIAFQIA